MSLPPQYFKRFRLELDLRRAVLPRPLLPEGFIWTAWSPDQNEAHAQVKFDSFRQEPDAQIFNSFRSPAGCYRLMQAITGHSGFLPRATWLISFIGNEYAGVQACGTVQGRLIDRRVAAIQNLAILPEFRGQGLGRALLLKCLHGFLAGGVPKAILDVTAGNTTAVNLYRSLGFRLLRTSYLEIKPASSEAASAPRPHQVSTQSKGG